IRRAGSAFRPSVLRSLCCLGKFFAKKIGGQGGGYIDFANWFFGGGGGSRSASSVPPKVLEAIRRKGRVAHGRSNRPMAQVILDGACVVAIVAELIASRMPQHVAVDQKSEACGLPCSRDHALIPSHRQRCHPLRHKEVGRALDLRHLPQQSAQGA